MKRLRETEYDVLVIGGGATGCGVALDAVTRGMESLSAFHAQFTHVLEMKCDLYGMDLTSCGMDMRKN